ncbi:hypothetical protein [Algoriphagus persicinus]|uniref:hypothetical protein n=1 Tax=Algoriphagus persicinus TaxID=3108754 RepID=UPI002B36D336|nr:hypothetical protein [Algoriphagus sp. E1-3-M2]MEB2784731.1 hypothetical protein [Algoriphagus sp. E1-3-M2]
MESKLIFKNRVKSFFIKYFKNIYLIQNISRRLILNNKSFLHQSGWINSLIHNIPIDNNLQAIPWFNYSFFDFIQSRVNTEQIIFEFGSGYSSIFFSKKVKKLFSVEHDPNWIIKIKHQTKENHQIYQASLSDEKSYINSLSFPDLKFDIIFVDGRFRKNCCMDSIQYLSESGVVILDDSERIRYGDVFVFMHENGFKELTFSSLKPNMNNLASTTVFYKANNCLGI